MQKYFIFAWKIGSRQKVPLFSTFAGSSPNLIISNSLALAFHLRLQKPMNSDHHFLPFSFSHWRPHFSYVFDMMPSCYNTCDLTTLQKNQRIQFYHIFPTFSNRFMLARFGFASQKLQTFQRTCPNMLRFRALMSTKTHCT